MFDSIAEYEASLSDERKIAIARGEHLTTHYRRGFKIGNRDLGMADVTPMREYQRDQAIRAVIRGDCCGRPESELCSNGTCTVTGEECPLFQRVRSLSFRMFGSDRKEEDNDASAHSEG